MTATLLEYWLDDLADDGLGPRGRQKALRTLSVALTMAVRRDLIGRNPARNVEGPRVVAKRVKAWTRAQARAFIVAAVEAPHLHGNLWLTQLGTVCDRPRRSRCTSTTSTSTALECGCIGT